MPHTILAWRAGTMIGKRVGQWLNRFKTWQPQPTWWDNAVYTVCCSVAVPRLAMHTPIP